MRYRILDHETGVVTEMNSLYPEPMTEEGYLFPARKSGARVFRDVRLPVEVTYAEKGMLGDLAKYHMIAGANMLGYRGRNRILPYTPRQIGELVGLKSRSKCSRFINKMLRIRVMMKVKAIGGEWQYYLNPAYFSSPGYRLSLNLFLLFRQELAAILPPHILQEFLRRTPERGLLASEAVGEAQEIIK